MKLAMLSMLTLAVVVSACAGPVATPTLEPPTALPNTPTAIPLTATAPPPTATLAPTATALPSPTPEVETVFRLYTDDLGLRPVGEWDSNFRDPGAIVYHAGQFHMFYNGINGWPRPVGIGYATSPDGYKWKTQVKQPVFNLGPMDHVGLYNSGPNLFATSALVEEDGTWVLYYYTIKGNSFTGVQTIGRATAPDPTGPWTPDPEPVLKPGPSTAWDGKQVGSADVHKTAAGYVMYYDGMGAKSMIGLATSPDGIHWTKYNDPTTIEPLFAESDPILKPDADTWDKARVMDPNVVPTDVGWVMVYLNTTGSQKFGPNSVSQFGYATSADGVAWVKAPSNPVISTANHPTWGGIYLATLVQLDDTFFLFSDVAKGNSGFTSVHLFTALDLLAH